MCVWLLYERQSVVGVMWRAKGANTRAQAHQMSTFSCIPLRSASYASRLWSPHFIAMFTKPHILHRATVRPWKPHRTVKHRSINFVFGYFVAFVWMGSFVGCKEPPDVTCPLTHVHACDYICKCNRMIRIRNICWQCREFNKNILHFTWCVCVRADNPSSGSYTTRTNNKGSCV